MIKCGKKRRFLKNAIIYVATISLFSPFNGHVSAGGTEVSERQEQAVLMARRGEYDEALRIFEEELGAKELDASEKIVYDYLAVLQWKGRDADVTALYEARYAANPTILPAYLLRMIGDSYYRLTFYDKAKMLYLAAKAAGDEKGAEALEKTALLLGELAPESPNVSTEALHEYAIVLARRGDFAAALKILETLIGRSDVSLQWISDYIVVLAWADKPQEALAVYERFFQRKPEQMTSYAQKTVGELLEAAGRYEAARDLYAKLAVEGNDGALLLAQINARKGDFSEAMAYYDKGVLSAPTNFSPYLERAKAWLSGGAYASADRDFCKARTLLSPSDLEHKREIDAQRAAAFLRTGEFAEGRDLLAPYVANGTATISMQCDYIVSLQGTVNYDQAIAVGEILWVDKASVPAYGLQSLADCYLRKKKFATAVQYHTFVLEKNTPQRRNSLLSRAYAYLKLGNLKAAKADYEAAIREYPQMRQYVAGDAKGLFMLKNFHAAKEVFRTLSSLDEVHGPVYRQHYAFDLLINEMPREAYVEYRKLAKETDAKEQGYAGMVQAAIRYGDYNAARAALERLERYDSGSIVAAEARKAWENRWRGSFSVGGRFFKNYQTKSYLYSDMNLEADMGNSWRVLFEGGYDTFREDLYDSVLNRTERPTAYAPSFGMGVRYMSRNFDISVLGLRMSSHVDEGAYRLAGSYYFNDFTWIDYMQRRATTENPGGLSAGIMVTERDLAMNRRIGPKDLYTFGYVWNTYSDGNRNRGFRWRFGHMSVADAPKEIEWYIYQNHTGWKFETPLYDSPGSRVGYGPGVRMRWIRPRRDYWEMTAELSFGYDAPDNTDFTPFVRLEKGWELGPNESFAIGGEYGWRSDRTNSVKTLREGYHQIDVRYNVSW